MPKPKSKPKSRSKPKKTLSKRKPRSKPIPKAKPKTRSKPKTKAKTKPRSKPKSKPKQKSKPKSRSNKSKDKYLYVTINGEEKKLKVTEEIVGEGMNAKVYLACDERDCNYVVKNYYKDNNDTEKILKQAVSLNITPKTYISKNMLIIEKMDCTLENALNDCYVDPETDYLKLGELLEKLYQNKIDHNDLHLKNIMVNIEYNRISDMKIIDFDIAKYSNDVTLDSKDILKDFTNYIEETKNVKCLSKIKKFTKNLMDFLKSKKILKDIDYNTFNKKLNFYEEVEENFKKKVEFFKDIGFFENQGLRKEMEDALIIQSNFFDNYSLFVVCDGHGGNEASELTKKEFPNILKQALINQEKNIKKAIENAYIQMDNLISETIYSGTTCVSLLINKKTGEFWCANVGDSRAILSRYEINYGKTVIPLTEDQKPNRPDEKARIEKAGGEVLIGRSSDNGKIIGRLRKGKSNESLALSRALGDKLYKKFGLIAIPEMDYGRVSKNDEFFILACDGVFDTLSNEEVCVFIQERKNKNINANQISKELTEFCIEKGSKDNISVIIIFLK